MDLTLRQSDSSWCWSKPTQSHETVMVTNTIGMLCDTRTTGCLLLPLILVAKIQLSSLFSIGAQASVFASCCCSKHCRRGISTVLCYGQQDIDRP